MKCIIKLSRPDGTDARKSASLVALAILQDGFGQAVKVVQWRWHTVRVTARLPFAAVVIIPCSQPLYITYYFTLNNIALKAIYSADRRFEHRIKDGGQAIASAPFH